MIKRLQLALLVISTSMYAQTEKRPACATMEHLEYLKQQNPQLETEMKQYNAQLQEWITVNKESVNRGTAVVTIPVVFHVLYNTTAENISDAEVKSQLDAMNADFMGTNADAATNVPAAFKSVAGNPQIQFCLAQRDPSGKATTGIIHKSTTKTSFSDSGDPAKFSSKGGDDAWDTKKYFNFWICDLGSALIGYAEFPTGSATTTFGVVSNYKYTGTIGAAKPFDKGRIGAHEGGHCFNLFHIWGDQDCGDDNVSDTPTQKQETSGCPTFPNVSCSNSPNGDMFMNYMDYTDDVCLGMYTKGQVVRMLAVINNLPYSALKTSNGCEPPVNTGINILAADNDLTIYPNPSNGTVTISFTPVDRSTHGVEIQNALGQILYKEEVSDLNETYSKSLDLQPFGKGIYTIRLRNKTGEAAKKVVIL
jgi:hypothetical protein